VNVDEEVFQVVISNYKNFETKSGRTRQIPLTIKLSTLLKLHKLECVKKYKRLPEYVFVHSGHRYSPSYVSDTFTKTARKAGLEGVHFHTLRHSFASLLVQRGVSLYVVQGLLGHSSIRVTEQYAHLAPSTLRKGIDALDEVLNPKR
jgi:site-specific recombinase XerD